MAADQSTNQSNAPRRRRGRRVGLIVLISLAALVLIGVVLLAFAPTFAGGYVRTMAQDGINDEIQGRATVARASLSWRGPQRIGPIDIVDVDGRPVANITIESDRGLWAMLGIVTGVSPPDLGTTTVTGRAAVIRRTDGTIHLQDVLQPRPDEPAEDIFLPRGLSARFVLDGLDVVFIDERQMAEGSPAAVIRVPALTGEARLIDAMRVEAGLAGHFLYGASVQDARRDGGTLDVRAAMDNLTEPDGRVAMDQARFRANFAADVSTAIADALAELDGRLVEALGTEVQARVRMEGMLANGEFELNARSAGARADVQLQTVDGVLVTPQPGVISMREGALFPLLPGFEEAVAAQEDVTFEQLPGATITLEDVRIPLPVDGRPLDLRGGTFTVALETGQTVGQVRVPQPDGTPGPPREYRLAPVRALVASPDLADRIIVQARTSATLGGESAGDLEVDLTAIDPLDELGRPRAALARDLAGTARLSGFATIILEPFVEPMGVRMAEDVGPQLDLVLEARAQASPAQQSPAAEGMALPPTHLTLNMRSANINADAGFLLHENVLRSDERGAELRIGSMAPLLTRLLAEQGLVVEEGAGALLSARDLRVDFNRLFAETDPASPVEAIAPGADLRAVAGLIRLETTPTAGRLLLDDQPARPWEVAAGTAEIDAADLQRGVRIQAQTSARLAGQPAGTLDADLRITDLLAPDGRPAPGLPAIDGRAALSDIATVIIQPLVQEMGLDLPRGAGPRLDLVLRASAQAAGAEAAMPRTVLDVSLRSEHLTGAIPLEFDGAMVRTRGDGAVIRARQPGALVGPGARDAGVELSDGGFLRITARNIAVALDTAPERFLEQAAGEIEIALGEFAARPLPFEPGAVPVDPLSLGQIFMTVRLAPERTPVLTLRGSADHAGAAFFMQGELQLVGLEMMDVAQVRPIGEIMVRNAPSSLAVFAMTPDPLDPFDPVRLVQDVTGRAMNINIVSEAVPDGAPLDRRLTVVARSDQLTGNLALVLEEAALHVQRFDVMATLAPQLAGTVVEMALGEQVAAPPRIASPARLNVSVDPISIPLLDGFVPDFTGAGEATLTAALQGQFIVDGLVLAETPEQPARPIGMLGLEDFSFGARFPLASLAPGGPPAQTSFDLSGIVLGAPDRPDNRLMHISASGEATVADAQPVGRMTTNARLVIADGWRLDQILGQEGMLAQGIGARDINVNASAVVDFPPAAAPAAEGGAPGMMFDRARITASVRSPRLSMPEPIHLDVLSDRIMLVQPVTVDWQMHQNWANRILLGVDPGAPPIPQEARFVDWMPMRLAISELVLSRGEELGPLLPGVFQAAARVTSPGSQIMVGGVQTSLRDLSAELVARPEANAIGFNVRVQDAGGGPGPGGQPAVNLAGGIYHIADPMGHYAPDATLMTVDGAAHNIPTAIVDGFTQQGGFLVDALGPMISVTIEGRGIGEGRGALHLLASSERARGEISGRIEGMRFIAEEPAEFSMLIITPEMGMRLAGGLPLVGHLEKTTAEEPAMIRATNLVLPLDGDLSALNAQIMFDPGEARFAISRPFAPLLRLIDEPREAIIGRRLQPITVSIVDGVMSYDRFDIPVGVFTFSMEGTVDLATRRLDVLTFIPAGALTEEVAGDLRTGLGGLLGVVAPTLDRLTMVPFRARGSFDDFRVEPDLRMLGRELQRELVRPDRIIGGTARDLLDRLINNNDNNRQQPAPQPR